MRIEVKNLKKEFHDNGMATPVLKGITLTVESGESLAVIGPSGAGKSTLLHIVGTLISPSSGAVLIGGKDLPKKEAHLCAFRNLHLGFVFQFHHLLPDFSALENVMMPLLIRGEKGKKAAATAQVFLEKVGLSQRKSHRPSELSGGEQQRVAIARALVGGPKIILADEPTGNLDHETGRKVFDLLLDQSKELKTTLVVVSHNEELTRKLSRTIRLVDGKIDA
ncbi:MAG: ABC transporter ATP-binding protein [Deltaproteobacteria bacterium]|nr:ABC transporter ATP-binding protein [Deltaproteobacteria bacterium]